MPTLDRLKGVRTSKAIKGPVLAATTANITLSGEQTIDAVALVTGDRVLVKDQTDGTENGIYVVDTGAWGRAVDFNKSDDIAQGTAVFIATGTVNGISMQVQTAADPVLATTALTFAATSIIGIPLAIPDGGTGGATAAAALVNLGLTSTADEINLGRTLALTTGTLSAYVASTGLSIAALTSGVVFPVRFHTACALNATIDVDTIGPKAIQQYRRDGSVTNVRDGTIQSGSTLFLRWSSGQFQIIGGLGFRPQEETAWAVKTSDETRTLDASATADTDLIPVARQPGKYRLEAQIIHAAGAGAIKFRVADPGDASITYQVDNGVTVYDGTSNYTDSDTSSADRITTFRGLCTVTLSTGVQVHWGQSSSNAANTTVKAGSYIALTWLGE
jgi:hypothetical protein